MRKLPCNVEAEQSVIGGVLLEGHVPELEVDDFKDSRHKAIWLAITKMDREQRKIDLVTIKDHLNGKLRDQAGGLSYVASIVANTPGTAYLESYAELVKSHSLGRKLIRLCQDTIEVIMDGEAAEPTLEKLLTFGMAFTDSAQSSGLTAKEGMLAVIQAIERAHKNPQSLLGVTTGLKVLDQLTLGFQPSDLIILAGRPSMGKTALALCMAKAAAKARAKVYVASLEMSVQQVYDRLLSSECRISTPALKSGRFEDSEWSKIVDAGGKIAELDIFVDDRSGLNQMQIYRAVQQRRPDIVFIDYLGLMNYSGRKEKRYLEIGAITAAMKGMAKDLNIPVVLLSQLNRESEYRSNPRPRLADLRESGSIEQDADLVLGLYRDIHGVKENPGMAEIIILKHRRGSLGTVRATFLEEFTSFQNLSLEE
jgi:replicative DNA helicase